MSPIRGSVAAGSSHGLGDARFAKAVTEVTAQRKEVRWTTSITTPGTNVTLTQTPVAGNLLVVMVSNNNALASPTVTYGGTTATQITGNLTTGICGYLFYVPLTSGNVASGGTTLNVTWSAGTVAAASITEVSGAYAASPIDTTNTAIGSWSSGNGISMSSSPAKTVVGALAIGFASLAGSQSFLLDSNTTDLSFSATWGSFTAAGNIYARSYNNGLKFTPSGSLSWALGSATARNGVSCWVAFRPAA